MGFSFFTCPLLHVVKKQGISWGIPVFWGLYIFIIMGGQEEVFS